MTEEIDKLASDLKTSVDQLRKLYDMTYARIVKLPEFHTSPLNATDHNGSPMLAPILTALVNAQSALLNYGLSGTVRMPSPASFHPATAQQLREDQIALRKMVSDLSEIVTLENLAELRAQRKHMTQQTFVLGGRRETIVALLTKNMCRPDCPVCQSVMDYSLIDYDSGYVKKNAYHWQEEDFCESIVLDPDGWRHGDGVFMSIPITKSDFMKRHAECTNVSKINKTGADMARSRNRCGRLDNCICTMGCDK